MVRTKSTSSTPGAVAHAVATKPKKNPLPSLLRKTKGSGIGASRLIPFSQRTHVTVATAVPGQTFPIAKVDSSTKPPISNLTVNQGSVQVSDLTDPPLHTTEREPPPLDEIRTTVTTKSTSGSNQSATSSLSHSTVVKPVKAMVQDSAYSPTSFQKFTDQATKNAENTVQHIVEATETAVHGGLKLIRDSLLEPSCPGVQLPPSTKGDAKMSLSIGSGILLQAPSPVTLNRVILQTQEILPPIRKSDMSPVSDAAVNLEGLSLETKPELQRQLSPQTDATVARDVILSNTGSNTDDASYTASEKPKSMDIEEARSKATSKRSAFRKVKALFGMGGNSNGHDKTLKSKLETAIATGIPVVIGKDVMVDIPKQGDSSVSAELAPTLSASLSDPGDQDRLSITNLTVTTALQEEAKKASPPSGHSMPSPMGIIANRDGAVGLEPSPSSVAAVARQRLPVDESEDDISTIPKDLASPQSPDAQIFETPTSPMENMRPRNSPELAIKSFFGLSLAKRSTDAEKVAYLLPAMGIQRLRKTGLEPDDEMVQVRVAVDAPEEFDDTSTDTHDENGDDSESNVDDTSAFVDADDGKICDDENNVVREESIQLITEKPSQIEKKMTLADILRTTTITDGFRESSTPDQNNTPPMDKTPDSPPPIRTGYNPFEKRGDGSNGTSSYSNSGVADAVPKITSLKTNPFDSSEGSGSGENDGIVVIQSTFSSEDDVDVFEKVARMNQAPKATFINPFDDSSDEEGIPPAPVSSSLKDSAAKLSSAILKGTAKHQKKERKSQGPLSDRFSSKGNSRNSFGKDRKATRKTDGQTKSKHETSSEVVNPAEPLTRNSTKLQRFPPNAPIESKAVPPREIEMDEGATISDLDQSLRNFPMRIVEATEGTIVMSALDLNMNDAQETITTRESFDEVIDRYAVSPSLELFRQKTRTVGFVAPDGRNSPALADSLSEIETTVVNMERSDMVVPPSAGILGLCNPFLLGSITKKSDGEATSNDNNSFEKERKTLEKAVDDNSFEVMNQQNPQFKMQGEESLRESFESDSGPAAQPSDQSASTPSDILYAQSLNPTPRISNEANHGAAFTVHHQMAESLSEAENVGAEILSTSKSSSNRKKKSLKEPVVYRVAGSKSRSFFDDESESEVEVPTVHKAIEENTDDPPGERFSESLTLLNADAPEICEADSDDFDASVDRYRSVEETPLNPVKNNTPKVVTTVIDEDENHLLNRIISFGKETLGMSPRTKDTVRGRWESMTPKSRELVERCLQYAEIENAIDTVGSDGGGTLEKVQSSGSCFTGPTPTYTAAFEEQMETVNPSRSTGTCTRSVGKEEMKTDESPLKKAQSTSIQAVETINSQESIESKYAPVVVVQESSPPNESHFTETIRSTSDNINDEIRNETHLGLEDIDNDNARESFHAARPSSIDDNESELLLNLGGSTVQRLIVTNSVDGTLRSLEAVWNEPTFTEDEGNSSFTEDDKVDRADATKPPESANDGASDDIPPQRGHEKLLISLSAELSEYLKAFSEDDSRPLSTRGTGTLNDKTYFASICESFSQPVSLQSLEFARDKLNEELKRDISMISALSKSTIEELLEEAAKIASKDSEVHDLIDLTGVPSQEEHAEGDAVWLFDVDGGKGNGSTTIFTDLDYICSSPFAAFRSSTAKPRGKSVVNIDTQKPTNIVAVEDMFFAMCENGEELVCGPEPTREQSLSTNLNNLPNDTIDANEVLAVKPSDVLEESIVNAFVRGQQGSFSEFPNMMDEFRSESETLQSYVTAKSMESNVLFRNDPADDTMLEHSPAVSHPLLDDSLAYNDGPVSDLVVDTVASKNQFEKNDVDAIAKRAPSQYEVEDILYSFCGDLENAVCGFEGYEVVPAEKKNAYEASTSKQSDGIVSNSPVVYPHHSAEKSVNSIVTKMHDGSIEKMVRGDACVARKSSESSVSSSDDFPTLLAKMQRDLRDPTVKEVKNPPIPENHLQSSNDRDAEGFRQMPTSPSSDIVNHRRDFLEILFDTTESLLCGADKTVSVDSAKKVRVKERRKSRKKTSKSGKALKEDSQSVKSRSFGYMEQSLSDGAIDLPPVVAGLTTAKDASSNNAQLSSAIEVVAEKDEENEPTFADGFDSLCHNAENLFGLDSTGAPLQQITDDALEKSVIDNAKKALDRENSFDMDTSRADVFEGILQFDGNSPVRISTPVLDGGMFDSDSVVAEVSVSAFSQIYKELENDHTSIQEPFVSASHIHKASSLDEIFDSLEDINLDTHFDVGNDTILNFAHCENVIVKCEDSLTLNEKQCLVSRRLAPVPEVYNPTNQLTGTEKDMALSSFAPKSRGSRVAPKPEFYASDKVHYIAGYVSVPIATIDSTFSESHSAGFAGPERNESERLKSDVGSSSLSMTDECLPLATDKNADDDKKVTNSAVPTPHIASSVTADAIDRDESSPMPTFDGIGSDGCVSNICLLNDVDTAVIDKDSQIPTNGSLHELHVGNVAVLISSVFSSNDVDALEIDEGVHESTIKNFATEHTSIGKVYESESFILSSNQSPICSNTLETDDVVIRFDEASDNIHGTIGLVLSVSKEDKLCEANKLANSVVDEIFEKEVIPIRSPRNLCLRDIFGMAESIISGSVKSPMFDSSNEPAAFTVPSKNVLEAGASIVMNGIDDLGRRPETPIILYDLEDRNEVETTFPFVAGEMVNFTTENENGLSYEAGTVSPTFPSDAIVFPVVNCDDAQDIDQNSSSTQDYSLTGTPVVLGCDLVLESNEVQKDVAPDAIITTERVKFNNVDRNNHENLLESIEDSQQSARQENPTVQGVQLLTDASLLYPTCENQLPSSSELFETEDDPHQKFSSSIKRDTDELSVEKPVVKIKVPSVESLPRSLVFEEKLTSSNSPTSAQSNDFSKVALPSNRNFQFCVKEQESTKEGLRITKKPDSCASSNKQELIPLEIVVPKSRKSVSDLENGAVIVSLSDTGEVAPFTRTLNARDDQNVSSLLKRLGITKDTVATSIGPMAQMIEFLEEDLSQDEESLSLLLALTRSETDLTSVTGSLLPESPSTDGMDVVVRDSCLMNENVAKIQAKRSLSFRSRMQRSKELMKKSKPLFADDNKFARALESSANSSSGNSEILRSPLLTTLLRRIHKNDDVSSNVVSSNELSLRKAMIESTDSFPSPKSSVGDIPLAIEIASSSNKSSQPVLDGLRSFDVCENVISSDSLLNSSGNESPSFIQLSSVMDRLHIQNRSSDSSSGFGRQVQSFRAKTAILSSKDESASDSLNLPAMLEELEIHASKSGSFSIVSTDVEPLDVEDLFHRYDKIVKQMVVLDDERLARVQSFPVSREKRLSNDSGILPQGESHGNRQRSLSVGSMALHPSSSDLTTPSQKARNLRLQLERALHSSAASRTSNSKLGKDLTTFQSLIQERRAISTSGRPRFTTQTAPSSPQVNNTFRGRSFYHRNCVSPSCNDRKEHDDAHVKHASSSLAHVTGKSPIARIRELAGKRQNWDLRSSKGQKHIPAPTAKQETMQLPTILVDELSPVVSIVDLVSKSSEEFVGTTEPIDLTDPYPDIVDLVTKSSTFCDDGSETALDYSDDGTSDSLQQHRGQRTFSGVYPTEFGGKDSGSPKYWRHDK